jgi:CelD/BcsL family acetyltransferase involved in cellulose biosynthesis
MRYTIITTLQGIAELQSEWRKLLEVNACPFMTPEWNLAWLKAYQASYNDIWTFAFFENETLVAILPLYESKSSRFRRVRMIGDITCDYQDIITRDFDTAKQAMKQVFDFFKQKNYDIFLTRVASTTFLYQILTTPNQHIPSYYIQSKYVNPVPYAELRETWEVFLESINRKFKTFKRKEKLMERDYPGTAMKVYSDSEITVTLLQNIARLHRENQFRKQGKSIFSGKSFQNLLAELTSAEEVGMTLVTLEYGDDIMAFILGFLRGDTFYYYIPAYEEKYTAIAPGQILLTRFMMSLIAEKQTKVFDFLMGSESYKYEWTSKEYKIFNYSLYPRNIFSLMRIILIQARNQKDSWIKNIALKGLLFERSHH